MSVLIQRPPGMAEHIDLRDRFSRAYWSECFQCTDQELIQGVRATQSTDAAEVGVYVRTRHALESFQAPERRGSAPGPGAVA